MNPKVNQVWKTKDGNIVLIVLSIEQGEEPNKLKMLWFNERKNQFQVSEIHLRLHEKVSDNPSDFFQKMKFLIGFCMVKNDD